MSAAGRWRPLVAGTSGSVTEAIYGLILATSVIAVSAEYDSSNAGLVGVTVLVTGVVFWLAHVYARVLAGSITRHRMLNRSEVRSVLRHDWPLVEVTVPLVLILALGVLDVVGDKAAILAATLAALVEAAAAGANAARASGAGLPRDGRVGRRGREPSAARSSCSKPSCTDHGDHHALGLGQASAAASTEAEGSTSGRRIMRNELNNPRRPARIGTSSAT